MFDEHALSRRRFLITGMIGGGAVLLSPVLPFRAIAQTADEATALVNTIRRQYKVAEMLPDARLEEAALYQARLMAKHRKIGHSIGWGNTFTGRLKQAGIRGPAAENVASGQKDVADVLKAWLNSAGHRKNLLDPVFTRFGLSSAINAEKPNYRYWAMLYGI
ncbi:CAP domain-containing protein [Pseudochrobactrum sp. MP213Fo]|uniref:CAP domain-containing protein n=1 Tax=Pseudochrobactrum sp. MP213Fo TaxID=3022250 RepID=UPI003BA0E07D